MSSKLNIEEKKRLKNWILPNMRDDCGIVVRTNARDANKEDILKELKYLYRRLERVLLAGKTRICYSLIEAAYPEYIYFLRDINSRDLEGIITDNKEIYEKINDYLENFQKEDMDRLSYYEDSLLPLFKLYSLESVLDHALKEKVWLKSGGFLTIQQTEAFVVIDVNSGKYEGKKKASETYRKINLEAAKEIAYQLRLRNLTGIILIDFINMENKDHQEELSHVLGKYLKQDTVKAVVVDITGLQIMEVTRKKVRKSLSEQIVEAKESREENI